MAERVREWRGSRASRVSPTLLASALLIVGGCGDDNLPATLMDGSRVSRLAVELEDVPDNTVSTKVAVTSAAEIARGSSSDDCLRSKARDAHPAGAIVERIGVSSESVTVRGASGMYGCDNSPGPREADRRWCGGPYGRLYAGHLRDPRLNIGCTTADGAYMGFAWVEPPPDARYVAVEQPGYVEVYEVAGALPVRVATTTDVEIEGSRASFRISEHDAQGKLLKRYVLEAVVAG